MTERIVSQRYKETRAIEGAIMRAVADIFQNVDSWDDKVVHDVYERVSEQGYVVLKMEIPK